MSDDIGHEVEYEIIIDDGIFKVVKNKKTVEVTRIMPLLITRNINSIREDIKESFFKRILKLKYENNIVFDTGISAGVSILGEEFEDNGLASGYISETEEVFSRKTIVDTLKRVCEFDVGDGIKFEIIESIVFENINTHRVCVFLNAYTEDCIEIVRLEYAVDDIYEPLSKEFNYSFVKSK